MMSLATIQQFQREAARRAAWAKEEPLVIWLSGAPADLHPVDEREVRAIPNIGSYRPEGWEPFGDHFMVDKTGWGAPEEPADTLDQFKARIARVVRDNPGRTIGWAFIEEGQFQMVAQAFVRV